MSKIGKREVPMTRSQQRRLLGDHLSFAAAEAYKLLRTNLMFALPDSGGCRVVGVTSALQGEGKSTTSMNTAYTIAETGQRVLLIEADMRLPNVARCLGLRPNLGLSDLLAGLCTLNDVVQPSGMLDNLRIIAAGSIPPNPMELLGSDQMGRLLDILRQFYDFIIFDLPPVNVVADGLVISRLVYGDNVFEKHGINRDRTGDREKTRYLCGKQGVFTRDRALIRPGFIRQLETRASTRSASFFHALGSPGRPHNGGGAAGAYRTRNGAKPLKQGHLRAKRGPLGPSRKSQQQTKRTGFAAHGHSIAETAPEGKRASRANGALIRA